MIKRYLLYIVIIAATILFSTAPAAMADANNQIFGACGQAADSAVCKSEGTKSDPVANTISVAANIIAAAAGIAAVVMAIISGLTMVSSAGNPEAVANAKKQLTYAILGVVIVALAWAITRFVVNQVLK